MIATSSDDEKKTADKLRVGTGKPGPGRPKGVPNKMTMSARDAITAAAEELGGANRLAQWAKEHPDNEMHFWTKIYPKLLPLQVAGSSGDPMVFRFEWGAGGSTNPHSV